MRSSVQPDSGALSQFVGFLTQVLDESRLWRPDRLARRVNGALRKAPQICSGGSFGSIAKYR